MDTEKVLNPFEAYKDYYDLLYEDKPYEKEVEYVLSIVRSLQPATKAILELGSGTGNYSKLLCQEGFNVTGVELSEQMNAVAKAKSIKGFQSITGDITSFNIDQQFDVAVSLFHVMSYLTTNDKVIAALKRVGKHLKPKSIFIFDVWYTPAVYSRKPEARIKFLENESIEVKRKAEPHVLYEDNVVEVHYTMEIRNKKDNTTQLLNETHCMRHFSTPEIALFAKTTGFKLLRSEEFLTSKEPSDKTWGVCYILQKND